VDEPKMSLWLHWTPDGLAMAAIKNKVLCMHPKNPGTQNIIKKNTFYLIELDNKS